MSYLRRAIYLTLASIFFALGMLGVILPGLPATPFLLLTSYFLVRSWPALNDRLLHSPMVGPLLRDWQHHGGVRWPVKIKAVIVIAAALALTSCFAEFEHPWLLVILGLGAVGIGVVLSLPNVRITHSERIVTETPGAAVVTSADSPS